MDVDASNLNLGASGGGCVGQRDHLLGVNRGVVDRVVAKVRGLGDHLQAARRRRLGGRGEVGRDAGRGQGRGIDRDLIGVTDERLVDDRVDPVAEADVTVFAVES